MNKRSLALLLAGLTLLVGVPALASCNDEAGARLYVKCAACHSLEEGVHSAGPSLFGIMGRKAGQAEGFLFSWALESSGVTWNPEALDAFLANPMAYIPGSVMPFAGMKNDAEREALVCWLAGQ